MYLKNLTMLGFKSFADKTSLNFQPGVTAIVGPNGCGKSNVSDAVRWVLGEQSAKALRGGEMADVIFTGTDGRKPLGMAEVSLTIGEVDEEHLRAAGVEVSYSEVTVTRRVFRDGGSEYFINKTPCRLKDIQQLFMGTGVGRTSYSIMAQGNITQLLSSKPEDRRLVFEEAAGITKFKAQKREALRKLEYTEQNLLRVADLVREVKRQIGSLQRQAGKARRFRQLQTELQHLETQLSRHKYDVLQTQLAERQSQLETLRNDIETGQTAVSRLEDELTQLRTRLVDLDQQIGALRQRGLELKGECERHESRIQFNEERIRDLIAQNTKAHSDITEAEERLHTAQSERDALATRIDGSEAALRRHRETLQERQEALRALEEGMRQQQEGLRQAQAATFAAAQELTTVRNQITALDLQKQGNVVRLEKLSAEKIQLEEERTRLEARLQQFQLDVNSEKIEASTRRESLEQRQARLQALGREIAEVHREQEGLLERQTDLRSRLRVLEQLESDHEGFSAGAAAALKHTDKVSGSLVDRMRVPDRFLTAIESALGHHLQLVLTEQPETAREIFAHLHNERKGRASIAPLALQRSAQVPGAAGETVPAEIATLDGVPVPALSVVECEATVRSLLERLLGMTRIVSDLDAAQAAWQASREAFHYVTLNGEFLSRHGVFTGGYAGKEGEARAGSILGRRNQIGELRGQLAVVQASLETVSRRKGALLAEQTDAQAGLNEAQSQLRQQEVAIATREGEFKALEGSLRLLGQKIETVMFEVQSLAAQDQEGSSRREALQARAAQLAQTEAQAQERVATLTADLEALRTERENRHAALAETRVALAAEEQLAASLRQQDATLQSRLQELNRLLEQRKRDTAAFLERKQQAESESEQSRAVIGQLEHVRNQVNTEMAALLSRRAEQETAVSEREAGLRDQRGALAGLQERRGQIDVELAQLRMSLDNLCERIEQKYHTRLADVRSECIQVTYADEGPARVETLTPEEMAAAGLATDWEAVAKQVEALQTRLDEMGPVNLVAIEEYEETEQRHQFLSQQHDDLVQAKTQLVEVLNRINSQTREMFLTTFNEIRANFQTMFEEVFGGGKADLLLVDEANVLESGIDIVARPPGKKLQSISLLSGGEQTMTAVSLLFSIYQVKPSPFCILDELDAPLDESNINRFIRVLQRFLAQSQFIIITHNKRTIGMADVLYGVTMQEQGVSRIVSVKFHKTEEAPQGRVAIPLVPPAPGPDVEQEEDAPHGAAETLELAAPPSSQ
jgi:chromosome segregation protein